MEHSRGGEYGSSIPACELMVEGLLTLREAMWICHSAGALNHGHSIPACQFEVEAPELTIAGNCMHQLGDMVQQICLYYVFHPPASQAIKDDPWDNQQANAFDRLVSDTTGIVAEIAGRWKENPTVLAVMGAFKGISLINAGVAFAFGEYIGACYSLECHRG